MVLLVRLLGIAIVFMGILFSIKQNALRDYILFWKNEKRLKVGGVLALLFGAIFLMAAPQCRIVWLIVVFGIWSVIKGVLLLILSPKKMYAYFDWWQGKSILFVRLIGIVAIVFGALLIYSA
ncbi:MAG: hypothetical protein WBC74_04740 [Candidatus Omnitrophota bacterium]